MPPIPAAFAIPGDLHRRTGGFIYEARVLRELAAGRPMRHVELPAGFPDPTAVEMAAAVARLTALPEAEPVILDGLVYGAIDTGGLARVAAPLIAMIHHPLALETGLPPERARHLHRTEAANLALAAHVVVPSAHTARILATDYGVEAARITVAPPGFDRPPAGGAAKDTPPLILSVGLLAERKGHDVLLAALGRIRLLPWRAEIAGPVHDAGVAAALVAQRDALGLAGRVTFRGSLDAAALEDAYARATIFALATRYEGYGMVLSEALLRGLPVVSCRTGAVPDTVPDGAGILVGVDDAVGFAAALERLLTDAPFRAGLTAAAAAGGAALPGWADTAAVIGGVIDRLGRL